MADMNNIPEEYHDFADVFSKSKAGKLTEHQPYNLKITLHEGTSPPFSPIYSLSQEELMALCKFIDKNLATGFICLSCSSHGGLVYCATTALDGYPSHLDKIQYIQMATPFYICATTPYKPC